MSGPPPELVLLDHPCLGLPAPGERGSLVVAGVRDEEEPLERLTHRGRLSLAVQGLATAGLLWEMGYWPGCAGLVNAGVFRSKRGARLVVTSVPRSVDPTVHRLGGGDVAIRSLRDGVLHAVARRLDLSPALLGPVDGPDWLGFEPWIERILSELRTPLDHWTARSLWALRLRPLPVPGAGEAAYWSVPWPEPAARLAAAAVLQLKGMGKPVSWLLSGGDRTATAPHLGAGEDEGALVLTGTFEPAELRAVERWIAGGARRRAVVVGRFPPGWNPERPEVVNDDGLDGFLWIAGVETEVARRVRARWRGRFQEEYRADGEALTLLAARRFREDAVASAEIDPGTEVIRRCLTLLPEGVPASFLARQSGLDELQVRTRARNLGGVSRGDRIALPVPELLEPDVLHREVARLLPPDDSRRLLAEWLSGGPEAPLLRWSRDRLRDLDPVAVLRLLGRVELEALNPALLEILAEAALETLDVAVLRLAVARLPQALRPVWEACLEAVDGEGARGLRPPGLREIEQQPRPAAEVVLRILGFRRHRGGVDLVELADRVAAAGTRLGGLLGRRLELEARVLAEPRLLDDRNWRRRMTADSPELRRALRLRAGLVRMAEGRHREAVRLLAPLADDEPLPGHAGLLELDLGSMALLVGRREEGDRRLLRSLRLLRAAGFVNRTRVVSFNLGVAELDHLRILGARRRFEEAGGGEEDPVARAELARLELAAGNEDRFRELLAGLPRGEEARGAGLEEAVALLDGVEALMRHDLGGARRRLERGGEEGLGWLSIIDALEGKPLPAAGDGDGWGLGLCATWLEWIRRDRELRAEELLPGGGISARQALALALCERLAGRQPWLGRDLRRKASQTLRQHGIDGWAALITGGNGAGELLIEVSSRVLDHGGPDAVPLQVWSDLVRSLGGGGVEVRSRSDGSTVWSCGSGPPGEAIQRGLVTVVPLGVDGAAGGEWELLASVLSAVSGSVAPGPGPEEELGMVGRSPLMEELRDELRRLAPAAVPVVLLGETGVGKELAARAIHRLSGRRGPFVAINMAALPHELAEAELFGAVKGAFTGADRTRRGLIAAAEGGTIFLDEIGELELRLQAKLLRFLESSEVRPVGSESARGVDVRVVSASNRDLESAQRDGGFRPDLFYRIASAQIRIPSLRQRREDIPLLVEHFTRQAVLRDGGKVAGWGVDAVEELQRYHWPGNVRELRNVVEVALIRAGGDTVRRRHLPLPGEREPGVGEAPELGYEEALRDFRRRLILRALERTGGNRSAAARDLGISRQTLLYHIRSLDIQ